MASVWIRWNWPLVKEEAKAYHTVAIGCTGGQHRSVALVELLAEELKADIPGLVVQHRELARTVAKVHASSGFWPPRPSWPGFPWEALVLAAERTPAPGKPASRLKGASVDQIADQLERAAGRVIRSATLFKLWARTRKLQLIRGEHAVRSPAPPWRGWRRSSAKATSTTPTSSWCRDSNAWAIQKRLEPFVPEDIFWTLWKSPRLAREAGFPRKPRAWRD